MCFKFSGTTKLSFPFVFKTSSNLHFPWSFLRQESSESANFWHFTISKVNRKITQTIVKHFKREIESNLSIIFFELWRWKVTIGKISCFNLNCFLYFDNKFVVMYYRCFCLFFWKNVSSHAECICRSFVQRKLFFRNLKNFL